MPALTPHSHCNSNITSSKRSSLTAPATIPSWLQFLQCHYHSEMTLLMNSLASESSNRAQTRVCTLGHTGAWGGQVVGDGVGPQGPCLCTSFQILLSVRRGRGLRVCVGGLLGGGGCAHTYTHRHTHKDPQPLPLLLRRGPRRWASFQNQPGAEKQL